MTASSVNSPALLADWNGSNGGSAAKCKEFRGHKSKVHSVAWSPNGQYFASGSTDSTVRVWSPFEKNHPGGGEFIELKGHSSSVDQLCWNPSNTNQLATASSDKSCRVWDVRESGSCLAKINSEGENINICWHPSGSTIAVGSKNDKIIFIDSKSYSIIHSMEFKFEVNEIQWTPNGQFFFVTSGYGDVNIIDFKSWDTVKVLAAHASSCYCIDFDQLGKYMATGGADAIVTLWDLDELICMNTFNSLEWPVRTLGFSHDGKYLAAGSEDPVIEIYSIEKGVSAWQIPTTSPINSIAWHPSKNIIAYAGSDVDKSGRSEGNVRLFGIFD